MYTQCPHCQTCFRISEAHLKIAKGKVRCGSCQEVFDATQRLFKNLTDREPITAFKQPAAKPAATPAPKPAAKPATQPATSPRLPPAETQHFDLFKPPTPAQKAANEIRHEREKIPDQSRFMESIVGNDRYNDLDQMGSIKIPGNIDFGDSFIKFAEEKPEPEAPKVTAPEVTEPRTPYEDIDTKEAAATTADHDSIKDFYAQVDQQLNQDDGKSQLDRDIDELLAFAHGLDLDSELDADQREKQPAPQPDKLELPVIEVEEEFNLEAIAEFEKELEATSTGVFAAQQETAIELSAFLNAPTADTPPADTALETTDTAQPPESAIMAELPAAQETPAPEAKMPARKKKTSESIIDELPSPTEDIPRALRKSLDSLNELPSRSLGMTSLLVFVILLLLAGLGLQAVLFRNVELAHKFPALAPLLTSVCQRLPCRYSGTIDVSQIKLMNRDVRSHPTQPNALLISAAFVNEASFDQPYPNILITLSDLSGNVVASRRFTPPEYLENIYNRFILMESGTPVHVTLAVLDPGNDAINFEFSFQ